MNEDLSSDLFLSHSPKDKAVVRPLVGRLRANGLKVWSDECVLKPGDSIPAKMEEGLEQSPVPACAAVASGPRRKLCRLAQAFGSGWAVLARPAVASERKRKADTFRSRDPQNLERRFIPLRLDDSGAHESTNRVRPGA